jgi:hypothetical protein
MPSDAITSNEKSYLPRMELVGFWAIKAVCIKEEKS